MALRDLPTTEMVALTRTWVDPGHLDYQLLTDRPLLSALVPELMAAHDEVLGSRPFAELSGRVDEIQGRQRVVDIRHDDVLRGLWFRLMSEEYLARDPADAAAFRALREALMPDGLKVVNYPYRQEVGFAEMIASRLTPDQEQALRDLATHDGDLHQAVSEWFTLADQLGELDRERNGLLPAIRSSTPGDVARARGRWMRVVDLMRRTAELLGEDPALAELLGRVQKAEDQAARRIARRKDEPAEPEIQPDGQAASEAVADAEAASEAASDAASDEASDAASASVAEAASASDAEAASAAASATDAETASDAASAATDAETASVAEAASATDAETASVAEAASASEAEAASESASASATDAA